MYRKDSREATRDATPQTMIAAFPSFAPVPPLPPAIDTLVTEHHLSLKLLRAEAVAWAASRVESSNFRKVCMAQRGLGRTTIKQA